MVKIVVLDGYTLFHGGLSFEGLKKFGSVIYYDRTPGELIAERIGDAEIVLTNKAVIDKQIIDVCGNIKFIGVLATGYNVVDVEYARRKNIIVSNVPTYGTASVVQHTFALILELCVHVGNHSDSVRGGAWAACKDFCYRLNPIVELKDKVLGIIGYGNIGKAVGRAGEAFGMKLLINDIAHPERASIEYVFSESDIVTLHCPLTMENAKIVNERTLSLMKKTAFLINTARGGLVDERALAEALNAGKIAGAGVDVLSEEPPVANNPLLSAENCIVTPHIAWASLEARRRLYDITLGNIEGFLNNSPRNTVN